MNPERIHVSLQGALPKIWPGEKERRFRAAPENPDFQPEQVLR
jgi:hypothetical protein